MSLFMENILRYVRGSAATSEVPGMDLDEATFLSPKLKISPITSTIYTSTPRRKLKSFRYFPYLRGRVLLTHVPGSWPSKYTQYQLPLILSLSPSSQINLYLFQTGQHFIIYRTFYDHGSFYNPFE